MYLPIEVIATWPASNYVNPVTRGPALIIMHLVLYPLVLGTVAIRVYTRSCISRSFGLDDIFIVLATLLTTAFMTISLIAGFHYGWDRHAWDLELDSVTVGLQLSLAAQIIYAGASALTRLSMLFLSRRILSAQSRRLRVTIFFSIILVALSCVVFIIVLIFQCSPISAWWTLSFTPQNCINEKVHLLVQGIMNIIADFLVVLIPIPVVLKLNLPRRQRIMVSVLFGAGFVVCVAGVTRTVFLYRVTDGDYDVSWGAFPCWLSSAVELYIGILCTSIPPTKPFFAPYIPRLFSAATYHHGSSRKWTQNLSSKNGFKRKISASSRDTEGNEAFQISDLSTPPHSPNNDAIHKKSQTRIKILRALSSETSTDDLIC